MKQKNVEAVNTYKTKIQRKFVNPLKTLNPKNSKQGIKPPKAFEGSTILKIKKSSQMPNTRISC